MAFTEHLKSGRARAGDVAGVRFGIVLLGRRTKASLPIACITLSKLLLEQRGWEKNARFGVLVGDGDDAGRLRLVSRPGTGAWRLGVVHGAGIFRCGRWPGLSEVPHGAEGVAWTIVDGDGLEIELPAWALRQAAPPAAATPAPLPPLPRAGETTRTVLDRTAALMGDPPPGRSAADRRR